MKKILLDAILNTTLFAALCPAGWVRADERADINMLRAEGAALQKQNADLEKRLNKLESLRATQTAAVQPGAQKQDFIASASNLPAKLVSGDAPLTWNGVTLFGNITSGVGWASHGLPANATSPAPNALIKQNLNHPYFGLFPNGIQQSTIGLKGNFPVTDDLAAVFMARTGVSPQSGQLSNGLGTLTSNNGLPRSAYSQNADSPRAGQAFNDDLYAGVSSKTFGQLTAGRHRPLSLDITSAYDPMWAAYSFSPISFSGIPVSGLGDTENARMDNSLKYGLTYGLLRVGAIYKFAGGGAGCNYAGALVSPKGTVQDCFTPHNSGGQAGAGFSYANLDFDGVIGFTHQAVAASPLSSAQLLGQSQFTPNVGAAVTSTGSNANTLSGTISDNTGWVLAAKYSWSQFKFYAGWAHVIYHNPANNLGVNAQADQGGYILSSVNNAAFPNARLLDTEWIGVRYAYNAKTEFALAYYKESQNTYGNALQTSTCGRVVQSTRSSTCSGSLQAVSAAVDHHFTKRFDIYGGLMVSTWNGGFAGGSGSAATIANGALNYVVWAPTVGARFAF